MIATLTTTPTGCAGRDCRNCTTECSLVVIYTTAGTVVGTTLLPGERYASASLTREEWPDKEEERVFEIPVDYEELKLWRREIRKRSRYRNPFNHKPLLKRRTLFSKSGWLARKGRLRKKGKK